MKSCIFQSTQFIHFVELATHCLITVRKTTHTTHDTEYIVVYGEYLDYRGRAISKFERSVVNARHVAGTRWLVLFGFEGEGVYIDVGAVERGVGRGAGRGDWYTLVVLVGLYKLEVRGFACGETVMRVELDKGAGVGGNIFTYLGVRFLFYPDEFLHRVVEVEFEGVGTRFVTSELELFDQVFMRYLGESAALISVKVYIVYIEFRRERRSQCGVITYRGKRREFNVDLNFVVLERNEGERKTRVAAEPELKGNVQFTSSSGGQVKVVVGGTHGGIYTAYHSLVAIIVTRGLGELVPDVEPVTVVLVDALTTDFDFYGFDELMTNPFVVSVGSTEFTQRYLEVHAVDEITVAGYSAGYSVAETYITVEGLYHRLHGEVGVATVNYFEESNLGVTGKVDILSAVGYELHKSSSHC
uniref:Uncharacterized protein n=1 Tax=viral metagenome TaxID=1070528 RepID=A0A6C0CU96_9ZZZZ